MKKVNRRMFLQQTLGVAAATTVGLKVSEVPGNPSPRITRSTGKKKDLPAKNGKPSRFRIGVESTLPAEDWWCTIYGRFLGERFTPEVFRRSLRELGAEFTLFYDSLAPRHPGACRRIADQCESVGIDYLFNNTYGDIFGPWVPGKARAEYPDDDLSYAARGKRFKGIILDEVEHRQIHNADCGKNGPYFADVKGKTLPECYDTMTAAISAIADRYRRFGGGTVAEMVFPVMGHVLARAGVIPAPKFLAESFPAVHFAICGGAALQYGTELWIVHDFWSVEPFWYQVVADSFAPGCSPEAYRSSLLLSYWLGADATYTEALHNLINLRRLSANEERLMKAHPLGHRGGLDLKFLLEKPYTLNAYGKYHRWFARHYVPSHPRPYSFRDIRPRVAIIRFPDTCWIAPSDPSFKNWFKGLYGPGGPDVAPRHTAWFDLWHILTHGVVPRNGLTLWCAPYKQKWDASMAELRQNPDEYGYEELMPFCPLDGVLVFDHRAGRRELAGAELIVLTGEMVSEETQQAALVEVKRGADCLALPHLLPDTMTKKIKTFPSQVSYGHGQILFAEDFKQEAVVKFVQRHMGPANSIRYQFGESNVVINQSDCGHGLLARCDDESLL